MLVSNPHNLHVSPPHVRSHHDGPLWAAYLIRDRHVPVATALSPARQINLMDDMRMSDRQPLEDFLGHAVPELAHPKPDAGVPWPTLEHAGTEFVMP